MKVRRGEGRGCDRALIIRPLAELILCYNDAFLILMG